MRKIRNFLLLFFSILCLCLSACSDDRVEMKLKKQLHRTFQAEEDFLKYQEEILVLEEEDVELYEDIISLPHRAEEKLIHLVEQAIQGVHKRHELLQKEREVIEASREEFKKIEKLLPKLSPKEKRKQYQSLYDTMQARYEAYEKIYTTYLESLQETESLYEQLAKGVEGERLQTTIDQVNRLYNDLIKQNERFNKLTKEYNYTKKELVDS